MISTTFTCKIITIEKTRSLFMFVSAVVWSVDWDTWRSECGEKSWPLTPTLATHFYGKEQRSVQIVPSFFTRWFLWRKVAEGVWKVCKSSNKGTKLATLPLNVQWGNLRTWSHGNQMINGETGQSRTFTFIGLALRLQSSERSQGQEVTKNL